MIRNSVQIFIQLGIDLDTIDPVFDSGNLSIDTWVIGTSTTYVVKYRV